MPYPSVIVRPCHHVRSFLPWKTCVRRSAASRPAATGGNHTRLPELSKIIGPHCPGPRHGAGERWRGARAPRAAWWTVTAGGCSVAWEWKPWMSAGGPGALGNAGSGTAVGCATVKLVDSAVRLPAGERQVARTLTRSPGANGAIGRKLVPVAEE